MQIHLIFGSYNDISCVFFIAFTKHLDVIVAILVAISHIRAARKLSFTKGCNNDVQDFEGL